jgi:hypothetical protein
MVFRLCHRGVTNVSSGWFYGSAVPPRPGREKTARLISVGTALRGANTALSLKRQTEITYMEKSEFIILVPVIKKYNTLDLFSLNNNIGPSIYRELRNTNLYLCKGYSYDAASQYYLQGTRCKAESIVC